MASIRKIEIRKLALDIIFKRVEVDGACGDFESLACHIAKSGQAPQRSGSMFDGDYRLSETDRVILNEVLHDLYVEKIITPGIDSANMSFPWFSIHSDVTGDS